MEQLKPCPFCGSKRIEIGTLSTGKKYIYCKRCFVSSFGFDKEQDAIEEWNNRRTWWWHLWNNA